MSAQPKHFHRRCEYSFRNSCIATDPLWSINKAIESFLTLNDFPAIESSEARDSPSVGRFFKIDFGVPISSMLEILRPKLDGKDEEDSFFGRVCMVVCEITAGDSDELV